MQKLDEFRYFLGRFERITGSAPKTRSLEEFLTDFHFNQRPGLIEMDGCLFVFFVLDSLVLLQAAQIGIGKHLRQYQEIIPHFLVCLLCLQENVCIIYI